MFLHILRKQMLDYLLSLRFIVGGALCLVIGLGATVLRLQSYGRALADYRLSRVEHGAEAAGFTDPFPLTYYGISLDKKPAPLQVFHQGLASSHPVSVRMTANRDPAVEDQYERLNPIPGLFRGVDLLSLTVVVMSLLALVFSYDLVSGEKETGTLRLTLSFPVPRSHLLAGKALGGYLALVTPYVLTATCCLLLALLYPGIEISAGELWAFLVLLLSGLLYSGSFFAMGLFVSARTTRSLTSITVLVSLWVALTLGVPSLSPYIGRAFVPVPAVQDVERRKWAIGEEEMVARGRRSREYLQATTDDEIQQGVVLSEFWRDAFRIMAQREDQVQADYQRLLDRQVSAAVWMSRLSPASSLIYVASEMADTGITEAKRFRAALHQYRLRFLSYCEDKWIERVRQGGGDIATADYPRLDYEATPLPDRVEASLLDLALLALWSLVLFAAAYVSFLRYDPR